MGAKRFLAGFLLGAFIFGAAGVWAADIVAVVSPQKVFVDGEPVDVDAYNVNNHNYYRLDDMAKIGGFTAEYDAENNAVMITTAGNKAVEPTATATPAPTATPKPGPSATPKPTATPEPTATPKPAPTALKYSADKYSPIDYGKYVDIEPSPSGLTIGVDIVYWGQTGNKIHTNENCSSFKNPVIWGTIAEAELAGHTKGHCGLCWGIYKNGKTTK